MILAILAGGKGTRLGFPDIPKPMALIDNKPLLEHQILLARSYGINEIFILAGYLSDVISDYFKNGEKWNVKINYIIEPFPLGTAGCVKQLEKMVKERFILFYGDVMLDIDLKRFIDFDSLYESIAAILVHPNDHPYDSDLIDIDDKNQVTNFYSKPHPENFFYKNLVNAGVYILSSEIFKYIPSGIASDFGKDIFPKILKSSERIIAYKSAEYCKDMGTKDRYKIVNNDFISGKVKRLNKKNKRKCIFIDRDGTINKYVDNLSNVENFELIDYVGEAIKKINKSEYLAIVATNQPMVAKGFLKEEVLFEIHKKMETLLGRERAYLNDIYYCPHHPESGFDAEVKELKFDCDCRKPKPGMLFKAASEYNIDLENSWMIGDSIIDMQAGKNACCRTIYLKDSLEKTEFSDFVFKNLFEAVNFIIS